MRNILIVLAIGVLLCGCQQSPRKNYYLLSAPTAKATSSAEKITTVIGIGPIEVAEYLNRLHLVYQAEDGGLIMADNDYWAEPLNTGIARVISLILTQRDNSRSFVEFPWRSDSKPDYSFRLRVHNLSRLGNQAHINATWELVDNMNKVNVERRHFVRTSNTGRSAHALTQTYSQFLAELAAEMDAAIPTQIE
jgi:uncharacterized lipoprotein YmbA